MASTSDPFSILHSVIPVLNLLALGRILPKVDLGIFSVCAPSHTSSRVSNIMCKKATSHKNPDFQELIDGYLVYKNTEHSFDICILTPSFACFVSDGTFHYFEHVKGVSVSINP
jgi:hypothetical protein